MRCKQFIFVSLAGVVLAAALAGCGVAAPDSSAASRALAAASVVVSAAAAEAAGECHAVDEQRDRLR